MGDGDDKILNPIEKTKKQAWKIGKCACFWVIISILCFVIGIALLVHYGKYWGDSDHWEEGLAYTGLVFVLIGCFILVVGIFFCIALYCIWKRINGPIRKPWKSPTFAQGEAPYPQQPQYAPAPQQDPNQPQHPSAPDAQMKDVHIEVSDHTKF